MQKTQTTPRPTLNSTRTAIVRSARAGKRYELASGPQIAMLGNAETEGAYELIEIEAVAGSGPPLHVHRDFDESFYVLEGELTLRVEGTNRVVGPGGVALIPAGAVHTWKNATPQRIRFLQFTVPGGMEPLTAALSRSAPLAFEDFVSLADEHGTTVVGPPI